MSDYKDDNTWLMLGDCLERMKEIPDGSVDAVICDPPYGMTACKWDSVIPLEAMWEQLNRIIKPNGTIVLFGGEPFSSALRMSNINMYRYDWKWIKNKPTQFPNANYRPLSNIEDIIIFSKAKPNPAAKVKTIYNPQGVVENKRVLNRKRTYKDVVNNGEKDGSLSGSYESKFTNYPRQTLLFNGETKTVHPTQKPVALIEYLIRTYTNEGETVLDFTFGSNTTGVACKNLARKYIGIEMDETYFNIGKERMLGEAND